MAPQGREDLVLSLKGLLDENYQTWSIHQDGPVDPVGICFKCNYDPVRSLKTKDSMDYQIIYKLHHFST